MYAELLDAWLTDSMAAWSRMVRYPFDLVKWADLVTDRKPPEWATPHEVIYTTPFAKLLDFSVGHDDVVPTLIFPPMAGHSSHVIDFEGQSQVQLVLDHGLTSVFAFEWLSATQETKDVTIEDRMEFISDAVSYIQFATGHDKINVIGNCQGGWEAAIWVALNPEVVNTLIVAGSPIDTSVDVNPDLLPLIRTFSVMSPSAVRLTLKAIIAAEGGTHHGLGQIMMFVAMHPLSHPAEHYKLFFHLDDEKAVKRFTKFYDWYFYPVDMSGALFQWVLPHLFIDNELYKGELVIGGHKVDLHDITCPLFMLAGEGDDITPKAQQLNMAKVVGSEEIHTEVVPGGHIGLFIGHNAQANYWPKFLDRVRELS